MELSLSEAGNHLYGRARRLFHLLILVVGAFALWVTPVRAADTLILAFGDSLTAGYQLPPNQSFPAQLQAALRKEGRSVEVMNAGVSGDTSTQGRARMAWMLASLKQKPDLAIVALGANDMLRGQPVAIAGGNLDAIITEFKRQKIPVLLVGMKAAPNMGLQYQIEYNALFPALAKKHQTYFYPFFLEGVVGNKALQLGDGMHPNAAGVGVMVRNILPVVRKALD